MLNFRGFSKEREFARSWCRGALLWRIATRVGIISGRKKGIGSTILEVKKDELMTFIP